MANQLTLAMVNELDFHELIYMERTVPGGMGRDGGILLVMFADGSLVRYETTIYSDEIATSAAAKKLDENRAFFDYHYGGFGNEIFLKKGANVRIDEQGHRFILERDGLQLPFSSSVPGVFKRVAASLTRAT